MAKVKTIGPGEIAEQQAAAFAARLENVSQCVAFFQSFDTDTVEAARIQCGVTADAIFLADLRRVAEKVKLWSITDDHATEKFAVLKGHTPKFNLGQRVRVVNAKEPLLVGCVGNVKFWNRKDDGYHYGVTSIDWKTPEPIQFNVEELESIDEPNPAAAASPTLQPPVPTSAPTLANDARSDTIPALDPEKLLRQMAAKIKNVEEKLSSRPGAAAAEVPSVAPPEKWTPYDYAHMADKYSADIINKATDDEAFVPAEILKRHDKIARLAHAMLKLKKAEKQVKDMLDVEVEALDEEEAKNKAEQEARNKPLPLIDGAGK